MWRRAARVPFLDDFGGRCKPSDWAEADAGWRGARREAQLMVSEKIDAAFEASASLMAGASGDEIVRGYRRRVAANATRLGRFNPN